MMVYSDVNESMTAGSLAMAVVPVSEDALCLKPTPSESMQPQPYLLLNICKESEMRIQ